MVLREQAVRCRKRFGVATGLVLLAFALSHPPVALASALDPAIAVVDDLTQENPNTSPTLVLQLRSDLALTVPSHLAGQKVRAVQEGYLNGLNDCFLLGLDAWTTDGPWQGYVLVYTLVEGHPQLHAEIPLRQHFDRMEELALGETTGLAIYGASGAHFTDLWIYTFEGGTPHLRFANGSAAGVDLRPDPATGDPQVWVGIENWDDPEWNYASGKRLWNVYTWSGDGFTFNKALSTVREVALEDRTEAYVARVKASLDSQR